MDFSSIFSGLSAVDVINAIVGAGALLAGVQFAGWATKKVASFFDEDAFYEERARENYETWWGDVESLREEGWTTDEINDGIREYRE